MFAPKLLKQYNIIFDLHNWGGTFDCHLSAARREKCHKMSLFWSEQNRIWSGKSQ